MNLNTIIRYGPVMVDVYPEDFTPEDISCYLGILECYTHPRTIDEFISYLNQVSSFMSKVRGEEIIQCIDNYIDIIQLYNSGFLCPLLSREQLSSTGIQYEYYKTADVKILEKLLINGVKLFNFHLDCPTVARYLRDIDSYRHTEAHSSVVGEVNDLLRSCRQFLHRNEYFMDNFPDRWEQCRNGFLRKHELGDPFCGRINAIRMHLAEDHFLRYGYRLQRI